MTHRTSSSGSVAIPPELYQQVHEICLGLTNATLSNDTALFQQRYENLAALHRIRSAEGHAHPFLTEALADFTEDDTAAAALYRTALAEAARFVEEPIHTKMIGLAERLAEPGSREEAIIWLSKGHSEAIRLRDGFWIERAESLRVELHG